MSRGQFSEKIAPPYPWLFLMLKVCISMNKLIHNLFSTAVFDLKSIYLQKRNLYNMLDKNAASWQSLSQTNIHTHKASKFCGLEYNVLKALHRQAETLM